MTSELLAVLHNIQSEIDEIAPLVEDIKSTSNVEEKIQKIRSFPKVAQEKLFLSQTFPRLKHFSKEAEVILLSLFAVGQGRHIFENGSFENEQQEPLKTILKQLVSVEQFYAPIGGIIGYHFLFLQLLIEKQTLCHITPQNYERPPGIDLRAETIELRAFIRAGIKGLAKIGEIYPVAGAADRLDLHHETTGEPLPSAELHFLGYTLLEGLIRDLEAREYLHFKLFHQSLTTPILLMTSDEKNNHSHICKILEDHQWFNRGKESFFFVHQPLVPMISKNGKWAKKAPFQLLLKPGGHGVLWKLAEDQGAISWLKKQHREQVLIRQINNPVAGVDHGLVSFLGIGLKGKKIFGFASCDRLIHHAEGMDVLIEKKEKENYEYLITNVEYTDFEKIGIQDTSEKPGSGFSRFPANTNILFADLNAIQKALQQSSIPGPIINIKTIPSTNIEAGRLECTMQNIADYLITHSDHRLSAEEKKDLSTYVTYNTRRKTISVAKKKYVPEHSITETPEEVFYTLLTNHAELLTLSGFTLPPFPSEKDFLKNGPSFFFTHHPALGPLFSIISQKLRSGHLHKGSELVVEIAEIDICNLEVDGSLIIHSDSPTGSTRYSDSSGKCTLKNVSVQNGGLSDSSRLNYWQRPPIRNEACIIQLEGSAEFYAENICFKGPQIFKVPDGHKMTVSQEENNLKTTLEKIDAPTWKWEYRFDPDDKIVINCTFFPKEGTILI